MPSSDAERAALLERLHEDARIGEALRGVGEMLGAGLDVQRVLQAVTDAATRLTGADFGAFFHNRTAEDGGAYSLYTLADTTYDAFAGIPMPRNTEIFRPTFAGEGMVRYDDVTRQPQFGANPPFHGMPAGHPPVRSYLAVPVSALDGTVIGGLFFGAAEVGVFDLRAERYAVALASQAVLALDNARLYAAERHARVAAEGAAHQLAVLQSIAVRVAEARGMVSVAEAVVSAAGSGVAADGALVGVLAADGQVDMLAAVGVDRPLLERWRRFPAAPGMPAGDALAAAEPVLLRSVTERDRRYPHLAGEADGQASWAVLPLVVEGEGIGILSFSWREAQRLDATTVALLTAIAQQSAQALDRARLDEAEQTARERLALLAEASRVLSGSLDPERTLAALARLLVPQLADGISVHLHDGRALRRVVVVHVNPGQQARMRATDDDPESAAGAELRGVLETGRPIYVPDVPVSRGPGGGAPDAAAALDHGTDVRSLIVVPLAARGKALGAVTLSMGPSGRRYSVADLTLVADLARRAGVSADTALRYSRERDTALTLQRALLPSRMPALECATAAARYVPGADDTAAGGDWYELIDLPGGRVGLVVGDVMGRGIRAAAVMGQLRTAVRAYATLDLPPAEVLTRMESVVSDLTTQSGDNQLVTCVYGIYEPARGCFVFASAGHPPPVLLRAGTAPERLPVPAGVPLGVGGVPFAQQEVPVPSGSVLVLYTDGLVESRTRDVDTGIGELCRCLQDAPWDLEALCEQALTLAGDPGAHDDDVAVLAVRLHGPAPGNVWTGELAGAASAPAQARAITAARLAEWAVPPDVAGVSSLLVSELVTNAVRHGSRHEKPVGLRLRRGRTGVIVEVADGDARLPRLRHAEPTEESGRGLWLVDVLATRWGARPTPEGKVLWFELEC